MSKSPRFSFGIIVLNGEPFTKYCLRQLYPHAYEIIVVEGGSEKARHFAPSGHSTDGTLESLYEFKAQEDPEDKIQIVTRDGFWSEKDEQSQAYAERATGDYLWQVDIDEFYRHDDIEKVRALLAAKIPDAVTFKQYAFWGSPFIIADSFSQRSEGCDQYHRLFKWGKGYTYKTHRPPTVLDENGIDLRTKRWIKGEDLVKQGIFLFHYSLLFPVQVTNKCRYYATPISRNRSGYVSGALDWAENSYFNLRHPFRVHNVYKNISWLQRFHLPQPEEAVRMWNNAQSGKIKVQIRNNTDAEKLLKSRYYVSVSALLSIVATVLKFPPLKWGRRLYLAFLWHYSKKTTL
jgi:glycosyltransferase involved in cell wall biosynthesis